jgi:hypothetical protein
MQELYDLADKFAKENRIQSIDAPGNNYFELFHEKFAELIVKETMQVVANQLPSNQYLDVAQAVIEHYKEH